MTKGVDEVARLFSAVVGQVGNAGGDVYPGYPGLVVAGGELRSMTWGFPLTMKGAKKPKPVNNTRADKLDSFMWRRRTALPHTGHPVRRSGGRAGREDPDLVLAADQACAGIWRDTPEWGPAYSMVMTVTSPMFTTGCP